MHSTRTPSSWLFTILLSASVLAACGGGGGGLDAVDTTSGGDMTESDATTSVGDVDEMDTISPPVGESGLTFRALLGPGSKAAFDDAARPFIPEDMSTDRGDLLIMLCAVDDLACAAPQVRVVDKDGGEEWPMDIGGPAPIQESFGPQIAVPDLPAGTYLLTVVYDSLDSQRRGFGWNDGFATDETAWGGLVSETDRMMSDLSPDDRTNPPPTTIEVTLIDGETLDLGDVMLGHYHERKISDPPAADTGLLVVGNKTDNAMRIVDLATYSVEESAPGRYDFPLVDGQGRAIDGTMCNVVPGPGNTVYALFTSTGLQLPEAGFAAQFDVATRSQVGGLLAFPKGESNAGPCRAIWHEHDGRDYLFAVAADSTNQGSRKGFWYADVSGLAAGDLEAGVMSQADDELFDNALMNVAAWRGEVYIGTTTTELPECDGATCLYIADFDVAGRPTLRVDGTGARGLYRVGPMRGDVQMPELGNQTVSCADVEQGVEYFGLTVETFKKTGQELLVVGNCHAIDMIDLAARETLDFDPIEPGVQGLNAALFGGGFYDFDLSPDGDTLWGIPANKSRLVHYPIGTEPMGDPGESRISIDRHALMPIDLSADVEGDLPAVSAVYAATDRDGFEGRPDDGIQDYQTPAIDPGIDVRGAFLKIYYLFWNRSLSGSLPNPFPVGPSIAVANHTVWLRGAGADLGDEGPSGLGQGSNLSVLDLDAQRLVLWPNTPEGDFYRPFVGLKQFVFGFDLTPARETSVATGGLVYMDL